LFQKKQTRPLGLWAAIHMVNTNTGNQGTSGGNNQKFVPLFEQAIMQYVILNKAQQGEISKDNIQSVFKGNLQMGGQHLDTCLQSLVQTGHLKNNGSKYTITDDGREDVQKVQHLVMELPQISQGGQRSPQRTNVGSVGGSTTNPGQPKGGQGEY
jgi:predicted transcriptional regulator